MSRSRVRASVLLAAAVLALPSARALAQATFYEAYDLAVRAEAAGKLDEARGYLLSSIALRAEPGRRVKTYGLNFLDVYDPHLRLARVAAKLGRLEEAETSLSRSRRASVSPPAELATVENEIAGLRARRASSLAPTAAPRPSAVPPVPTHAPTAPPAATPTAAPAPTLPAVTSAPPSTRVPEARASSPTSPTSPAMPKEATSTPVEKVAGPIATGATETPVAPEMTAIPATPRPLRTPSSEGVPEADASGWPLVAGAAGTVLAFAGLGLLLRRRFARRRVADSQAPTTSRSAPTSDNSTGTQILSRGSAGEARLGDYVLEGILGQGGMGTTYRARRRRDGLAMVVKVPHEHVLSRPEFAHRFVREGQLGATLHHPNIIRIFEAGETDGRPFIAMELVDGITLEKRLESGAPIRLAEALRIARDVALALDYAHLKGVVHRDLKPENVMLVEDRAAKVMDYGIARLLGSEGLTATDMYLGTPLYSAPESVRPPEVDAQSDLYSLGIILYRMLTGRLPFRSTNPLELLQMHVSEPLPPFPAELALPESVWQLVSRMTAKQKSERYASAELLLRDLDAILNRL